MPTATTVPQGFIATLRDAGVDVVSAARAAGLDPTDLEQLSVEASGQLLCAVFATADSPGLAVRIGSLVRPELFGVVGLAALTAPTYGSAIARCARYKRLVSELRVSIKAEAAMVYMRAEMANAAAASWQVEVELAFFASFGRRYARTHVRPRGARLRAVAPAGSQDIYAQVFGCPVHFGQSRDEIWFDSDELNTPLVGADEVAHALLVQSAEAQLNALSDDVVARAGAAVAIALPEGPVRIGAIARALAMSERSFQRALSGAGTTFTALVDATRHRLALHYLRDGRFEPTDIAFLIGFSHLNSFYRAFRRWTGTSPESYRQTLTR